MESWFCWISIWTLNALICDTSAEPSQYVIHSTPLSFDEARKACSPGVLTTLVTKPEVTTIYELISKSVLPLNQSRSTFWVSLRMNKTDCVDLEQPLRGFRWMGDDSQESQVYHWLEEPEQTCTTVRCAALRVNGLTAKNWGLVPDSCKSKYQFICKMKDTFTHQEPHTPTEPHKPVPTSEIQKPEPTALPTETRLEPEVYGADANPGSSCQNPHVPTARFLTPHSENGSQMWVECWSNERVVLHCSGLPPTWHLLNGSPANFTTICNQCDKGFHRDTTGNCVDVDECSAVDAPCRHGCQNTQGSYQCVCTDESGQHHNCTDLAASADSGLQLGILVPVLVAIGALVLLLVLVVVIVMCCLMRKRRAEERAEKMAMENKYSLQPASEKAAV